MKKIIILDYNTNEVHVFDLPLGMEAEYFLVHHHSEHGYTFTEYQCKWMVVDLSESEGRLPIYIH